MGRWLTEISRVVRFAFGFRRKQDELDTEMNFHLEEAIDDLVDQGMSREDARKTALCEFGGVERVKEECRDSWSVQRLLALLRAWRFALRLLIRHPATSVMSIVVLTLGLGTSIIMFAVAGGLLWPDMGTPYDERIVSLEWGRQGSGSLKMNAHEFLVLQSASQSFEKLAVYQDSRGSFRTSGDRELARSYFHARVSADFFELIGVGPMIGRAFGAGDSHEDLRYGAVISHRVWKENFQESPSAIGETIYLQGHPCNVVGVMPPGFGFPAYHDVWTFDDWQTDHSLAFEDSQRLGVCALLKEGVTRSSAIKELDLISSRFKSAHPDYHRRSIGIVMGPFGFGEIGGSVNIVVLVAMLCSLLVLLVACVSASNLIAARALKRSFELATRVALGASRWDIVMHVMFDAFAIAICSATLGWLLANWGGRLIWSQVENLKIPRVWDFEFDVRVFLFAVAVTAATAIFSSLVPAIRASRLEPNSILKDAANGVGSLFLGRLAKFMIVAQVASSCAFLIIAIIVTDSVNEKLDTPLGVDSENILTSSLSPRGMRGYETRGAVVQYYRNVQAKLEALPGIETAAFVKSGGGTNPFRERIRIDGESYSSDAEWPMTFTMNVSENAFEAYGVNLLAGRSFTPLDNPDSERVCIVSEAFAQRHWPRQGPIGKRLSFDSSNTWYRVVGLAPTILRTQANKYPKFAGSMVYTHFKQRENVGSNMGLLVRVRGSSRQQVEPIRRALREIAPDLAPSSIQTLEETWEERHQGERILGRLYAFFGIAALVLSFTGLYAVMHFASRERVRENGIRMALGALRIDILWAACRRSIIHVLVGLLAGVAVGYGVARILVNEFFHMASGISVTVIVGVIVSVLLISALATGIPAWVAAKANPSQSLRVE